MTRPATATIERMTTEQWRARIQSNKVYRAMRAVEALAHKVARGDKSAAIISGPSGVGKTYLFEQAFKQRGVTYEQPRVASEQALIEVLSEQPDGVFLFDECDFMFKNLNIINVLKRATDTKPGAKVLDYRSRNKKLSIEPFRFTGRIVILTNTNLHSPALLNCKRLGDHLRALNDRCEPFVMSFDHEAIWEYTCYLTVAERMLFLQERISRQVTDDALRFFTETMWRRQSVSPRALTLLARNIKQSPDMWREIAENALSEKPFTAKPVPPIPQLPDPKPRGPSRAERIVPAAIAKMPSCGQYEGLQAR